MRFFDVFELIDNISENIVDDSDPDTLEKWFLLKDAVNRVGSVFSWK